MPHQLFSRFFQQFAQDLFDFGKKSRHTGCHHQLELRNGIGDFNDVATSYTYKQLATGMTDAHREAGSGMGITYTEAFPGFRIDFVLHQPHWQTLDCYTIDCEFSDHYPVVAWLRPAKGGSAASE